jgi:hypothetical protein
MIRLALFLALLPASVLAETCYFGPHGTSAEIQPGAETFAEIVLRNKLAGRLVDTCEVTIFGATFAVYYDPGKGGVPDDVSITVPPGFAAEPPEAVIADGDTFTFLIRLGDAPGS